MAGLACGGGVAGACSHSTKGGWSKRKVECGATLPVAEVQIWDDLLPRGGRSRAPATDTADAAAREMALLATTGPPALASLSPFWAGDAQRLCIDESRAQRLCFE
eukprot:1121613-Prymnesium_polylepis.1